MTLFHNLYTFPEGTTPEEIAEFEKVAKQNDFVPGHRVRKYTPDGIIEYQVTYTVTEKQRAILDAGAPSNRYSYNPDTGDVHGRSGKILKPYTNSMGYHSITINDKILGSTSMVVHRLAFALLNVDIDGLVVHHDNENKTDNRLKNLIPMTESEHYQLHNDRDVMLKAYLELQPTPNDFYEITCPNCATISRSYKTFWACFTCPECRVSSARDFWENPGAK